MNKLILLFLVLIGLATSMWFFFFYDNVVTTGTRYGFVIGMTKDDAVEVIGKDYADKNIQVVLSPSIEINPSNEIEYLDVNRLYNYNVNNMDVWELRFRRTETDVLVLRFSNDRLIEMTRYRRAFIP